MNNQKVSTIMIGSVAAVLLFSIGFIQESEQQISQGTLTIIAGCTLTVPTQTMALGTASIGDIKVGGFDVRNTGNQAASANIAVVTPNFGAWATISDVAIIAATETALTGDATGTLDAAPISLAVVQPDALNPGNNDAAVVMTVGVNPTAAFSGDLFLDLLLVNTGCV